MEKACSWARTSDSFHMEMGFKIYVHISPSMQSRTHTLYAYTCIWQQHIVGIKLCMQRGFASFCIYVIKQLKCKTEIHSGWFGLR